MRNQIHTILHATECAADEETAVAHAARIAVDAGADLNLFHARGPEEPPDWKSFPHCGPLLKRWSNAPELGGMKPPLRLHVEKARQSGQNPVRTLIDRVHAFPVDLIVMSTHQRTGLDRWRHETFAEPAARGSHIPTLFVPAGSKGFVSAETGAVSIKNVLIPVDSRPNPSRAIERAYSLCHILKCPKVHFSFLHVGTGAEVPAVEPPREPGWTFEIVCWEADVVERIHAAERGRGADLIVMATAGHHGFLDALRGSVSERVLRRAECPVLAVPDPVAG
jgi:nucleotide-binding universal stress UspA family protein